MRTNLVPLLLAAVALSLIPSLPAQTWTGASSANWEDPANWDTGVVPDGPGATAYFSTAADPLNPRPVMNESRTLGGIGFTTGSTYSTIYASLATDPHSLRLEGTGLTNNSTPQVYFWLTDPGFNHVAPITLTFANQATVSGDLKLIAIGENRRIEFRDHASAGSARFSSYHTDFYDDTTAGSAQFDQATSATVGFHDRATAGNAALPAFYGLITFADYTTAGTASIKRSASSYYGASASVEFRDHSSAGNAEINVTDLAFSGHATADHARISNFGVQVYSSHGEYATFFSRLTFNDSATAAAATITNNSLAFLGFAGDASAGSAQIENSGTVTFSERAALAGARIVASSGTFYVNAGYNQAAKLTTVGSVYFKDQAGGGDGSIEIASASAALDFSGLFTGAGTSGRALLPANPTTPVVRPDDGMDLALGAITNTTPGGRIYLGITQLHLGAANRDMTLSALITDTGGAYGSAAGEQLRGGGLSKTGTGTLTISNPDNDYSGLTVVSGGGLNLAGGRISNAVIALSGRLTGSGTVRGLLANNGLVSPGNSVGTIQVTGPYTQDPAATLAIELGSSTSYDRVIVEGAASLGGTLTLSALGGYVPVGDTRFDFLTASAVGGQFSTVNAPDLGAALSAQLVYASNGVQVQVTQKPFARFGGDSPAAAAFGGLLDAALPAASGDPRALLIGLNQLDAAPLAAALGALAPDRYSVLAANAFATAAAGQTALDRRLAAPSVAASGPRHHVYFEGGYRRADFDAVDGLPNAASRLGGGMAGAAWHNDSYDVGISLGYESGVVDLDEAGSRADIESIIPQVFFRYAPGNFRFLANAAFSQDDYELQRRIAYEGVNSTAVAAPSGKRTDLGVTAGYALTAGTWSFTPYVGVLGANWELDDFTETGAGGANLAISTGSIRSLRTRLGVEAVRHSATSRLTPRVVLAWWHEWEDDRSFDASFAGSRYKAPGRQPDEDFLEASLSLDARLGPHSALFVALGGAWGRNSAITSDLSAGFRWAF